MSKTEIVAKNVMPAGDIAGRQALKLARIQAKAIRQQQQNEMIKAALANPLVIGLAAMAGNELLYRSGAYEPAPGEKSQSVLGGPVWFKIGDDLPAAQAKRNFINTFIIGVTTAQAMAPAMPAILQAGSTIAKALAVTA